MVLLKQDRCHPEGDLGRFLVLMGEGVELHQLKDFLTQERNTFLAIIGEALI